MTQRTKIFQFTLRRVQPDLRLVFSRLAYALSFVSACSAPAKKADERSGAASMDGALRRNNAHTPCTNTSGAGSLSKEAGATGAIVNDVFSVGNLYRIDLLQEAGRCVAEVFMGNGNPDGAPIRLALGMNAPCYVRRWTRNEPTPTAKQRRENGTPINSIGGAQVWEIPIDGKNRRVFAIVGDCQDHSGALGTDQSARLRCGKNYQKIMELDGKFLLSKVYGSSEETCALTQEEEIVGFWVTARDP